MQVKGSSSDFYYCHIDNVLVHDPTRDQHIKHLSMILRKSEKLDYSAHFLNVPSLRNTFNIWDI